jgi:ectoine hydroxylase-related dioxygenase (phytanoyl-CoA dioxygenase family)
MAGTAPPHTDHALPPDARAELAADAPVVTAEDRAALARDGFVRLRGVLSEATVAAVAAVVADVARRSSQRGTPLADRSVYQQAFLQEANVWQRRADVRPLVFSPRLGRVAADAVGATGVRLYHDQALVKEAGGGRTPWHCDQRYWPLDTDRAVTIWIPLQDTPLDMGPLRFRRRSHEVDLGRGLAISADGEQQMRRHPRWAEMEPDEQPFSAGDVSLHTGWTFHGARPNATGRDRLAMTTIYLPDGTRLTEPTAGQTFDRRAWLPDAEAGEPIDSWLNPVVWAADGAHAGTLDRLPPPAAMVGTFTVP